MDKDNLAPDFVRAVPPGDDRVRSLCRKCGFIDYKNPKIVVGSVATWRDRIILCKRAIEPRKGYWTLPAGYLENGETAEAGAAREAWEEARIRIELDQLLAVYSVPRISQIQLIFRARLKTPEFAAGPESEAVELFDWDRAPWPDLAFPTVGWSLRHHREALGRRNFAPFGNPVDGV